MRVRFSIGVAKGDADRGLLEQYRSGSRPASAQADPARRPTGWPVASERADDDSDPRHPPWAW